MAHPDVKRFRTPRDAGLGLTTIANGAGLTVSILPNGMVFAIEHRDGDAALMVNQVLGSPLQGGIGRLCLRGGGADPFIAELVGPGANGQFAAEGRSALWTGEVRGVAYRVELALHPDAPAWTWTVALTHGGGGDLPCDLLAIQDVGLGPRGFLMGSEAYASQYIDHHIARHGVFGRVVMSRQNLSQANRHPWLAQGCLQGAVAFATDAIQLLGPDFRLNGRIGLPFGTDLPSIRRQHEVACTMLQSPALTLGPGRTGELGFFGLLAPDHPDASGDADLARLSVLAGMPPSATSRLQPSAPARSLLQDAPPLAVDALPADAIDRLYPERRAEEYGDGGLLSFFVSEGRQNRHVVLAAKERQVARRHGALLRSGQGMLLDDSTLCATAWMHGVFAAQLTIGNTSFHKLFSVSRDPYNITRASGLRILVDDGQGWRLLGVPSAFEIGLSDSRWIYRTGERTITVRAMAAGDAPALQYRVEVDGPACRFLVFGHVVMGERDYEQVGLVEIDHAAKRVTLRPDADWLWGQKYPQAVYHVVTGTPDVVEAVGGDELVYADGEARGGPYIALRSHPTQALAFAVVGSMTDAAEAGALAARFSGPVADEALLAPARRYWSHVTRDLSLKGEGAGVEAQDLFLPWLAHDAMIHLTVPHGLEQYTGAAWGTRDVCQGPVEFLLAMEHDSTVREILRTVFSEQVEETGDWPQWFMLDPYAFIRAGSSHGDVIVWPLKALCDYIEATNDLAFLEEKAPWRVAATQARTAETVSIAEHVEKLLETARSRFIPGTHLMRYGEGDWNDSLQPADEHLAEWLVSSWTVSLLYEQVVRYAAVLDRAGNAGRSAELATLADAIRADFNRLLMRDGIVAGYGLFNPEDPDHAGIELLLHPSDRRTGLTSSLIAMTQPIIGGLFTPEQSRRHLDLIKQHLLFPDGVRLMDRPLAYSGGLEKLFRRAESSPFFGREIGLMYVHAHIRYSEALAMLGDAREFWDALALVNPIAVTDRLPQASLRQRNCYFSSSDAAFFDRYHASDEWDRVKAGTIAVDGGWRIYSSGPGLYTRAVMHYLLGVRRKFGTRSEMPTVPVALGPVTAELTVDGVARSHRV